MKKIWEGGVTEQKDLDLSSLMTSEDIKIDNLMVKYEILGLLAYHLELYSQKVLDKAETVDLLKALLLVLKEGGDIPEDCEDVHSYVQDRVESHSTYWRNLRIFLSRNDQSHTNIRLFLFDFFVEISVALVGASKAALSTASGTDGVMPGYTHYRQAMPTLFSTYMDSISRSILDLAVDSMNLSMHYLAACPLGYGSGFGSKAPIDKQSLAKRLGFDKTYDNPINGASFRGLDDVDALYLCQKILIAYSRISQDLIYFSSDELGFLSLPEGFTTGSSLMPNKKNPDFLEMVQGYASQGLGQLAASISMIVNKGFGYHREFQISKDRTITSISSVLSLTNAFKKLLKGLKFDPQIASKRVLNSTFATDYAYSLFQSGRSWKESYEQTGRDLSNGILLKENYPIPSPLLSLEAISAVGEKITTIKETHDTKLDLLISEAKSLSKG